MSDSCDYWVAPLPWVEVDGVADDLRKKLQVLNSPYFRIVDVLENVLPQLLEEDHGFSFQVASKEEMGSAEGLTCPQGTFIRIREDVYEKACNGDGRSRFTLSHELGHFLLHTGQNQPLARVLPGEKPLPFESAEKQADRFAATLLMPFHLITEDDDEFLVMERFGVSKQAAIVKLEKMIKAGLL